MDDPFADVDVSLDAADKRQAAAPSRVGTAAAVAPAASPPPPMPAATQGLFAEPMHDERGVRRPADGSAPAVAPVAGRSAPPPPAARAPATAGLTREKLLVNKSQRGNPVLNHITHVWWEYADGIRPDYVMGKTTCALYLSLRYHATKPRYLFERIRELRADYRLRVVLVQLDRGDVDRLLLDISRIAMLSDFTVICASTLRVRGRCVDGCSECSQATACIACCALACRRRRATWRRTWRTSTSRRRRSKRRWLARTCLVLRRCSRLCGR